MSPALLVSLVAVGIFAFSLHLARVEEVARRTLQHTYQGISAMTDAELTDDEKELIVRHAGIAVFFSAWSIGWRFSACIIATFIPIYLADITRLASETNVIGLMLRPDYIILVSVSLIGVVWLVKRGRGVAKTLDNASRYSMGERLLHMFAVASPKFQKMAAQVDDVVFRLLNRETENHAPIFVTSLARGGTTAVLNAFGDLPFIATHTYRDMPFITAPYLWGRLSRILVRNVVRSERAHGDGLEIDLDSPEAFEEVYWKLYWSEKYHERSIAIWHANDVKTEATARLQASFRKIAYVRGRPAAHYLSKNNANIARLRLIRHAFPDAHIVVPVRRPAPHAASLLRQHRRFLALQSNDDFIRRYMRDIGHFEFGLLHTPFAFDDFDRTVYSPDSPDYWLGYWIAAFREVHANLDHCHIVLQDDLRRNANSCMRQLLAQLGFDVGKREFTSYFRGVPDETDISIFSPDLLTVADSLYDKLSKKAVQRHG